MTPDLDIALADCAALCRRLNHGKVTLVVSIRNGQITDYELTRDTFTGADIDKLMREKPHVETHMVLKRTGRG
jgi:hypothetical protein